jgi:hypothetical protein
MPGASGTFLSPVHNGMTVDQTECQINSPTPEILGYTL